MNTASFSCGLRGAEISVTDEKPLESGVLRMWKINCKNVNSVKPFKTEGLRVMAQRKVVRTLTAHHSLTVFFVIMISSAGFPSASSTCSGGLTTVPIQVNIVCFLCISQQLCFFLFWRWAAQWYDDILILLPDFSTRWVYIESVNTSIIKVFMLLICRPTLFLCPNSGLMFFKQYQVTGKVKSGASWTVPFNPAWCPFLYQSEGQSRRELLCFWGAWLVKERGNKTYMILKGLKCTLKSAVSTCWCAACLCNCFPVVTLILQFLSGD